MFWVLQTEPGICLELAARAGLGNLPEGGCRGGAGGGGGRGGDGGRMGGRRTGGWGGGGRSGRLRQIPGLHSSPHTLHYTAPGQKRAKSKDVYFVNPALALIGCGP